MVRAGRAGAGRHRRRTRQVAELIRERQRLRRVTGEEARAKAARVAAERHPRRTRRAVERLVAEAREEQRAVLPEVVIRFCKRGEAA
jgi:hypothetical protein